MTALLIDALTELGGLTITVRHDLEPASARLMDTLGVTVLIDERAPACARYTAGRGRDRGYGCVRLLEEEPMSDRQIQSERQFKVDATAGSRGVKGSASLIAALPTTLDDDIVRALAWCRLGSGAGYGYPENNGFTRAEKLGLLDHTGVWRATPQGEGVLIALGLLDPIWQSDRTRISVLWARETDANKPVQFIAAWPDGIEDCWPDLFAHEVAATQKRWQEEWAYDGGPWEFWTTVVEIPRAVTS